MRDSWLYLAHLLATRKLTAHGVTATGNYVRLEPGIWTEAVSTSAFPDGRITLPTGLPVSIAIRESELSSLLERHQGAARQPRVRRPPSPRVDQAARLLKQKFPDGPPASDQLPDKELCKIVCEMVEKGVNPPSQTSVLRAAGRRK